ncbi:hypothetical protein [Effusibacillus pohliae]|uniref:hypothetical protein n=1 Tax=Effusibacillus pohliae TaxID=232270 RepID=UPI00037D210F|nr:hypothetical protein [Effusibacillus pohliae]
MNVTYNIQVLKIGSLQGTSVVSIGYVQHDPDLDWDQADEWDDETEDTKEGIKSSPVA